MAPHNDTGTLGEATAAEYLQQKGYEVLQRNWRPPKGRTELDIVAVKDGVLAFVEVKTRSSVAWGEPMEAVNYAKIRHLTAAAQRYMRLFNVSDMQVRFDIISVIVSSSSNAVISVHHVENAFMPPPIYY
jgi:putative endonuclease